MVNTLGDILTYVGIVLLGFLIWAALSPFEVLGWWAGWFGDEIYAPNVPSDGLVRTVRPNADAYVVFLSGIGRVSGENFSYREQEFLRRLARSLPDSVIIDDIFPYSVNNLALTGQPFFARLWRWALQRKLTGPRFAGYLINIRNIWQTMISADRRYGPLFNQAAAEVILHGLLRYDYDPESRIPVFVIGYSGAGMMAIGTVTYLKEWLDGPVYSISLGGVFSSDQGALEADHVFHLFGDNDHVVKYSMFAPGRWPVFSTSAWNRARRQGKVTAVNLGPMDHAGSGGYLDAKSELPDGTPFVDKTTAVISEMIQRTVNSLNQVGAREYTELTEELAKESSNQESQGLDRGDRIENDSPPTDADESGFSIGRRKDRSDKGTPDQEDVSSESNAVMADSRHSNHSA